MSSEAKILTIKDAIGNGTIQRMLPGEYSIRYTDNTHRKDDDWTTLLTVEIEENPLPAEGFPESLSSHYVSELNEAMQYYTLADALNSQDIDKGRVLQDNVAQSLVRTGILRPSIESEAFVDVFQLARRDAVILVPDTNALSTGTLHWLLHALSATQIWILPVVVSLIQVQQRGHKLKNFVGKKETKYLSQAIRSRTLINSSLCLLERCRERYQVLEIDPQLLRYVRPAGKGTADPDEGDVLEDRLLIEAIHTVFRATRSRAEKRVVTSDVLLTRILRAEGIPTLFLQTPSLPRGRIQCLYYEAIASKFLGSSLIHLLWDLAHCFSSIQLLNSQQEVLVQMGVYWSGKTATDWNRECLQIQTPMARQEKPPQISSPPNPSLYKGLFSTATLPEASFLQVLRLGGALLQGQAQLPDLIMRMPESKKPSKEVANMGAEFLLRAGLAITEDQQLIATKALESLDQSLEQGDLDEASAQFRNFGPYRALLEALQMNSRLDFDAVGDVLAREIGKVPSKDSSKRFIQVPVYLGQAWREGSTLCDGTARPDDDTIMDSFRRAFDAKARDGLCAIKELLFELRRSLRISPWFAFRQLARIVEANQLAEYSFQPSAGKPILSRCEVFRGGLADLQTLVIPMDRIQVNGRPVFTVGQRSS